MRVLHQELADAATRKLAEALLAQGAGEILKAVYGEAGHP